MDDDELVWALEALDRTETALRLIGPGRRAAEVQQAAAFAREQVSGLRGMVALARQEAELQRRTLVLSLPALAVSPAAVERMAAAHHTDASLLDAYEEVLTAASRAYHTADMRELYRVVGPHVGRLADRLRADLPDAARRRLGRIAAETAILAGWAALVVGRETFARAHYRFAEAAALAAGSGDLQALAVEAQANLVSRVFYGGWEPSRQALFGLRRAEALLDGSAPSIVQQWVRSRLAHELALAGDETFLDLVDQARAIGDVAPGEEPTGLHADGGYWASGSRLIDVEAVGLARTGRTHDAETMLRVEMATTPDHLPRRRVGIAMVLGHVLVEQGECEETAAVLDAALDLAEATASRLDVRRLDGVYRRLAPWSTVPAVRDLGDRLAAI